MDVHFTIEKKVQASIDRKRCINCGLCRELCPTNAIGEYQKTVACLFADCGDGCREDAPVTYFAESRKFATETACSVGCPLGIVPQAIAALVKAGDWEQATQIIGEKNPLPWITSQVCDHFCQEVCKRGLLIDEPINMIGLERYLVSKGIPASRRFRKKYDEKIAIIGGGPAGITAAWDLAKRGYRVEIFEKDSQLGGAMNWGIPPFRLDRDRMREEIDAVLSLGIEVSYHCYLGQTMKLEELWEEGFDCCLIATGASYGIKMDIPGADGSMVYDSVAVMRTLNGVEETTPEEMPLGQNVLIIGGGGSAVDLARMLVRQGKDVVCTTIDSPDELQISREELETAEAEGIRFKTMISPKQIIREGDTVKAVEFLRGEYLEDRNGGFRAYAIKGSEFNLFCDTVIFAIGQKRSIEDIVKAETYPDGRIKIDPHHRTNKQMIFACGEATGESSSVVEAMAAGREAAKEIDDALQQRRTPWEERILWNGEDEETLYPENVNRLEPQYEKPVDNTPKKPEPMEDILPILRAAGIDPELENLQVSGRKVAIAGGGIAGITAAVSLAKKGYAPTIFEKTEGLGGRYRMFATDFRINKATLQQELKRLEKSQIPVVYHASVGIKPSFEDLYAQGYEAVLFAIGETDSQDPELVKQRCGGIYRMQELLYKLARGEQLDLEGKRILVIGSDEMTFDLARKLRERKKEVTIAAPCGRGSLQVVTAAVEDALTEGVNIVTGVEPFRIREEDGKLDSLDCRILENQQFLNIPCDVLILGDTSRPDTRTIGVRNPDLEIDRFGYFVIDAQLSTSLNGVFAIGDFNMSAPDAGRAGAAAIDNYLSEGGLAIPIEFQKERSVSTTYAILEGKESQKVFAAEKQIFTDGQALTEASRCMNCGDHREDPEMCMGCGICMQHCPADAITMVAAELYPSERWPNIKDMENTLDAEAAFLSGEQDAAETFAEEVES